MYYCWKAQRCLASIKCLEISMFIIRNGGNGHQASCMWHLTTKALKEMQKRNVSENLMYNLPLIDAQSNCYVFSYGVYVLTHFKYIPTIIFPTPFLHMITEKNGFRFILFPPLSKYLVELSYTIQLHLKFIRGYFALSIVFEKSQYMKNVFSQHFQP